MFIFSSNQLPFALIWRKMILYFYLFWSLILPQIFCFALIQHDENGAQQFFVAQFLIKIRLATSGFRQKVSFFFKVFDSKCLLELQVIIGYIFTIDLLSPSSAAYIKPAVPESSAAISARRLSDADDRHFVKWKITKIHRDFNEFIAYTWLELCLNWGETICLMNFQFRAYGTSNIEFSMRWRERGRHGAILAYERVQKPWKCLIVVWPQLIRITKERNIASIREGLVASLNNMNWYVFYKLKILMCAVASFWFDLNR